MSMVIQWRSEVYYLLPMRHVFIKVKNQFSASERVCYLNFLKSFEHILPYGEEALYQSLNLKINMGD